MPPSLIVRLKTHFHTLPFGVDLIVGLNGYIWVSKTVPKALKADGEEVGFGEESGEGVYSGVNEVCFTLSPIHFLVLLLSAPSPASQDISPTTRLTITRIALLLTLLANHCIPISAEIITEAYHVSVNIVGDDDAPEGVRSLARYEVGEQVLRALALGRAG